MENSLVELARIDAIACARTPSRSNRSTVLMRAVPDFNPTLEHERVDPVLSAWAREHGVECMRSQVDLGFLLTVCCGPEHDPRVLAVSLQAKLHEAFCIDYFFSFLATANPGPHALADLEKTALAAQILRRTDPIPAGIWSRSNAVQAFRDSLWSESFGTHAQPIVCMQTLTPIGYELLARARCAHTGELIPTGEWIPAVVGGHDSLRLALTMLKLASEFMEEQKSGYVTINITGTDLSSPQFRNALALLPMAQRSRLVLEMIESEDLLTIKNIGRYLDNVRSLGCRVALDDFGTEHATFTVLRSLQFDIIKLDIGLVQSKTILDRALVDVLLEHAQRTKVILVAEGIETKELMTDLMARGFKIGQGYYLDAALSASSR